MLLILSFQAVFTLGDKKLEVVIPGTGVDIMRQIKARTSFFLQDGALLRANTLFQIQYKQRLVAKVQLIDESSLSLRMFGKHDVTIKMVFITSLFRWFSHPRT